MTQFTEQFNAMMDRAYTAAAKAGWWDKDLSTPELQLACDKEQLLLIMMEVAEAGESLRRATMEPDKHIPEFTELEAELADVVLRCMQYSAGRGLKLAEAIECKHNYNMNRPFKHGGKKF